MGLPLTTRARAPIERDSLSGGDARRARRQHPEHDQHRPKGIDHTGSDRTADQRPYEDAPEPTPGRARQAVESDDAHGKPRSGGHGSQQPQGGLHDRAVQRNGQEEDSQPRAVEDASAQKRDGHARQRSHEASKIHSLLSFVKVRGQDIDRCRTPLRPEIPILKPESAQFRASSPCPLHNYSPRLRRLGVVSQSVGVKSSVTITFSASWALAWSLL
jgi:hypothetical protein